MITLCNDIFCFNTTQIYLCYSELSNVVLKPHIRMIFREILFQFKPQSVKFCREIDDKKHFSQIRFLLFYLEKSLHHQTFAYP